jgi:hypothetical protein
MGAVIRGPAPSTFGKESGMIGPYDALLAEAIRAPSGDNTQPWRFHVDVEAGTIVLEVDESRDPSPMNAGQRMARIAIGAALENLLRAARDGGWDVEHELRSRPGSAVVYLSSDGHATARPGGPAATRATNRLPYDGRPVPPEILETLARETPPLDDVQTCWIAGPGRLESWADLIGRADAVMFGEPSMRKAFLAKVRLDAGPGEEVDEGLSPAALGLTAADRFALRLMRWFPDGLLKLGGVARVFAAKARQLVTSSSGLCLVIAPDGTEMTDLVVGRAMQRAWLALEARGLAAQPMMSLAVLENSLEHGPAPLVASLGRGRLEALRAEARALVAEVNPGRLAALLRFGYAPPPDGHTGRRPLHAVTTYSTPTTESMVVGRDRA